MRDSTSCIKDHTIQNKHDMYKVSVFGILILCYELENNTCH